MKGMPRSSTVTQTVLVTLEDASVPRRASTTGPQENNRITAGAKKAGHRRSNEVWLADLRGQSGAMAQHLAHEDLTSYLFVVVLNHLQWKHAQSTTFAHVYERELAPLARDFVQDFMVKLVKEEYALLSKYSGRGRFTSWAAQVAHNLVGGEMRKAYWHRETETAPDDLLQLIGAESASPESIAMQNTVADLLYVCLDKLPEHYRTIIERCILLEESATDIAHEENVTPNAIYIRLHRAKEQLRKLASAEGLQPNMAG